MFGSIEFYVTHIKMRTTRKDLEIDTSEKDCSDLSPNDKTKRVNRRTKKKTKKRRKTSSQKQSRRPTRRKTKRNNTGKKRTSKKMNHKTENKRKPTKCKQVSRVQFDWY